MNVRKRVWEIVEVAQPGDATSHRVDILMLWLIFLNVLAVIVGSVQSVQLRWGGILDAFELVSVAVFTLEYVARLWSCTVDLRFQGGLAGRARLALRPLTLIDLLAFLPFYLPFLGLDLRSLRALRLFRILRVVKVGRYYTSLTLIKQVVQSKKEELILTSALMGLLLVISSSVLFYCENTVQPDQFSSIPATMWWAVATLTTVGYGDMCPITGAGKLFASISAIVGIGMFALPAGILGAGFIEVIQKSKAQHHTCPQCGAKID